MAAPSASSRQNASFSSTDFTNDDEEIEGDGGGGSGGSPPPVPPKRTSSKQASINSYNCQKTVSGTVVGGGDGAMSFLRPASRTVHYRGVGTLDSGLQWSSESTLGASELVRRHRAAAAAASQTGPSAATAAATAANVSAQHQVEHILHFFFAIVVLGC